MGQGQLGVTRSPRPSMGPGTWTPQKHLWMKSMKPRWLEPGLVPTGHLGPLLTWWSLACDAWATAGHTEVAAGGAGPGCGAAHDRIVAEGQVGARDPLPRLETLGLALSQPLAGGPQVSRWGRGGSGSHGGGTGDVGWNPAALSFFPLCSATSPGAEGCKPGHFYGVVWGRRRGLVLDRGEEARGGWIGQTVRPVLGTSAEGPRLWGRGAARPPAPAVSWPGTPARPRLRRRGCGWEWRSGEARADESTASGPHREPGTTPTGRGRSRKTLRGHR